MALDEKLPSRLDGFKETSGASSAHERRGKGKASL